MGLEIPDSVKWLSWIVGSDWPEGDETAMRRAAQAWYDAGVELDELIEELRRTTDEVLSVLEGAGADEFRWYFEQWLNVDPQHLPNLRKGCDGYGRMLDQGALDIEYAKYMFIATLIITAIEIIWLIANAVYTFGGSLAGIPIVQALAQLSARLIGRALLRAIAMGVAMGIAEGLGLDLLIQAIQAIKGDRTEWDGRKTRGAVIDGAIGGALSGGLGHGFGKIPGLSGPGGSALGGFAKGAVREGASEALAGVGSTVISAGMNGEDLSWKDIAKGATSGAAGGAVGGGTDGIKGYRASTAGGDGDGGGSGDGNGSTGGDNSGDNSSNNGSGNNSGSNDRSGPGDGPGPGDNPGSGDNPGTGNGPSGGDSTSGSQTSDHGGDGSNSGSNGPQNSSGGSNDGSTNTSSNGSSTNTSSNSPDSGSGNGSNTNTGSSQTSSNDGSGNTPNNSGGDNSGTSKGDGGNSHNPGDTNRISSLLGNGGNDGAAPSLASTNNGDGVSHNPASHNPAPSTPAPAPASVPSPGDGGSPNSPSNSSSPSNQQASNLSSAPSTTPSGPATTPSSAPVGGAPASTPPSSGTSSPGPVPTGVPSSSPPRGGAPRTNTEAPSRPETTRSPVDRAPSREHRPRTDKQDAPSDSRPRERSGSDTTPDRRSPANEQPSPPQKAPERFPTDKQDAPHPTPSGGQPRERSGSEKVPVGVSPGAAPRGDADDAPTRSEPDPTNDGADDSSPVPEGLPENLRDVWRNSDETPAGRSLHTDPQMRDLARRVPADPDRYILDGHGNPDGMRSGGRHLTVDEVAGLIRNDPNWNGREVMLISCRTGDGDFARQLAQRLGVPVTAPHGKAWTDDNGNVYSSSTTTDADNGPQPTWPPDGGWTTHGPDGTRTPSGRDGFAPGHPRQDAPNTDGDGGRRTDDPASNDRTPSRDGDSPPGREENAPPRRDDTPSPQENDRRQPDSPDRAPENGSPRERADEDAGGQTGKPKDSPELTAKKQEQLRTQTLGDVNDPTSTDPTTPLSEHYHLNDGSAHRNNVNDGHPQLQWNKDTGRWEPATNRPLVIADHIRPKLPKVRSDDAQRQRHERLMEMRRDAINEVARAEKEYTGDPTPENKKVRTDAFTAQRNFGERLGERAADQAFDDLIRDRFEGGNPEIERLYPFNDPFDVPDEHVGTQSESPGRGEYDRVYKVTVDGHTHYFVVEAKGPTAPLGKREIDDVDYQQGHPKYFRDILKVMIEKGGEDKKVALEILNALNGRTPNSSVEYHVVRALVDDGTTGQGRIAAGEKEDPGDPHSKHKHIGTRENPVYGGYDRQQFDLDSRRDYDRAAKRFVDGTENPSPDPRSRSADDTPSHLPQEPPPGAMARGTDDDAPPPRDDRSPDQRARDAEERLARDAVTFPDRDSAYDYGGRHWNESAENLPQDQKDAVRNYTDEPPADHPTYKEINGALRDGTTPSPEVQRHIDALDRALNAHPTPETIVVTRGTDLGHLNMPPESMVGHTFQDPGFLSTSLGPPAGAAAFKDAVIHMRVPEGTPALWVEKLSEMGAGERELILPRGLKFRVDEVVRIDGKWQVYASVVPADTPVTAPTDRTPATAPAPTPTPPTPNAPFATPPATGPSSPPTPWTAPAPSPAPHPATANATPNPPPPATPSWATPAPATPPTSGATPSSTPPATPPWAPAASPNGTPPNSPAPNTPFATSPATGPSSPPTPWTAPAPSGTPHTTPTSGPSSAPGTTPGSTPPATPSWASPAPPTPSNGTPPSSPATPSAPAPNTPSSTPPASGTTPGPTPHSATPGPVPPATPSWAAPAPTTPSAPNTSSSTPPASGTTPGPTPHSATPGPVPPATPSWAAPAPATPPNGTPPSSPATPSAPSPNTSFAAPPASGPSSVSGATPGSTPPATPPWATPTTTAPPVASPNGTPPSGPSAPNPSSTAPPAPTPPRSNDPASGPNPNAPSATPSWAGPAPGGTPHTASTPGSPPASGAPSTSRPHAPTPSTPAASPWGASPARPNAPAPAPNPSAPHPGTAPRSNNNGAPPATPAASPTRNVPPSGPATRPTPPGAPPWATSPARPNGPASTPTPSGTAPRSNPVPNGPGTTPAAGRNPNAPVDPRIAFSRPADSGPAPATRPNTNPAPAPDPAGTPPRPSTPGPNGPVFPHIRFNTPAGPGTPPHAGPNRPAPAPHPSTPGTAPHPASTPHNSGNPSGTPPRTPSSASGPARPHTPTPGHPHSSTPPSGPPRNGAPTPHGPVPRNLPPHLHDAWHGSTPTPAGRSFHSPHDADIADRANRVASSPGSYVVDGRGAAPDGITFNGRRLSAEEVAALIRSDPNAAGRQVVLLSQQPNGSPFARELAQRLGTRVVTPNGPIAVDPNGGVISPSWSIHEPPADRRPPRVPSVNPLTVPPGGHDPSHRPGEVGPDGVRRFATDLDGSHYGETHLSETYRNLPPDQRQAVYQYTVRSEPNRFLRPGGDYGAFVNGLIAQRNQLHALVYANNGRIPTTGDLYRISQAPTVHPDVRRLAFDFYRSGSADAHIGRLQIASAELDHQIRYFGEPPLEAFQRRIAELDRALSHPLPESVQVERGLHDLSFLVGADGHPLGSRLDPSLLVGTVQTEHAPMSTSLGSTPAEVAQNPFPHRLHIRVPEGFPGLWMGSQSAYPDQRELILPRGVQYRIDAVQPNGYVDAYGRPAYTIWASVIPAPTPPLSGHGPVPPTSTPPSGPPPSHSGPPSPHTGPAPSPAGPPSPHAGPSSPHTGPPSAHGGSPSSHAEPSPSPAGPSSPHTGPPPTHGGPPSPHTGPAPSPAGPPSPHAGSPPTHGGSPSSHAERSPAYAGPPPTHGGSSPAYAGPSSAHGEPPSSHTGPPSSYAGSPPAHGGSPSSYAGPPSAHSGPPPSHAGSPSSHGGPPSTHGGPPSLHVGPSLSHAGSPGPHDVSPSPHGGPSSSHAGTPASHGWSPSTHGGPPSPAAHRAAPAPEPGPSSHADPSPRPPSAGTSSPTHGPSRPHNGADTAHGPSDTRAPADGHAVPSHREGPDTGDSRPVPEGLPENLRDVWRNSDETPAGRSLHTDPQMRDLARRVPADPNRYILDGHGDPDSVNAGGRRLGVDEVADLIRNDPNWNGREVMLISCHTGDGDFARRLAQRLGVPVTAPHGKAWSDTDGNVYASSETRGPGDRPRPTWPPDGGWTTHGPDGTRTPSGRDGFAPGHPRQDLPKGPPLDGRSRGASTDRPPGNGTDPNADGRGDGGSGSSNARPERSDTYIADDGVVRPVPEGHYRLASDPQPYIRDLANDRLHHPEDEPGTYRTEKSYRLKCGARFIDDPLADRSKDITYGERRTRKVPLALSSSARGEMDALVERRSEIDASRQEDNRELKRLVARFGIRKEDVNSDEKLAEKREEILAEMESGDLSPEERRRVRDDLRSLYEVARRYNAAGSAMSRISEQMGMVAAKDFLDGRYGATLLTPQSLAPGKPTTADVTAVAFERGRGGETAVLYTVEAKGVGSQLGSRLVEDMKRAAQGAPEYSRFILKRDIDLKAALDARPELQKRLKEELEKENLRVRSYYVHVNDQGEVNWARFHLDRDGAPIRFTEIAGINV